MSLTLYNTLTRKKELFRPLDPANVRMYVCGPTVYDFAHIGNARPVIVFDVLFRLLRHLYGADHVKYVRNITDVDDKINARAKEEGVPIGELTARTTKQFHDDVKALGCLDPNDEPRATDNIPQMIELIEILLRRGHAYEAAGEVLFDVSSMANYGSLSNRNLDEQQAGARVAVEPHKRNPGDFVLWKLSGADEPGWESPWGRGRPGWHSECSAMSKRYLGEVFDIHGGGIDLIFPHHENEIAQSRCAHGTDVMANVWMHNGFLQVEGQKMSKSLGNFVTINDSLNHWGGAVLRLNMLKTNYRQPIDWTQQSLKESGRELSKWSEQILPAGMPSGKISDRVVSALADDLNTPDAITELRRLHKFGDFADLLSSLAFLGISLNVKDIQGRKHKRLYAEPAHYSITGSTATLYVTRSDGTMEFDGETKAKADSLVAARAEARKAKDWAESDRIRDELTAMGIAIKDNKDGTTSWEVKR